MAESDAVGSAAPATEHGRPAGLAGRLEYSWWAGRWFRALAQVLDANRLSEGRACVRAGRVVQMEVQPGLVLAEVQSGADVTQASCRVRMATVMFSDAQWERIISLMGQRALYAAQLVNGEMPEDIEAVFQAAGVSLFPTSLHDLGASCSCSEWPSACRHVVAASCMLGEWIDGDPFLLFALRGRTKEQIMGGLRALRAGQLEGGGPAAVDRRRLDGDDRPARTASRSGRVLAVGQWAGGDPDQGRASRD